MSAGRERERGGRYPGCVSMYVHYITYDMQHVVILSQDSLCSHKLCTAPYVMLSYVAMYMLVFIVLFSN